MYKRLALIVGCAALTGCGMGKDRAQHPGHEVYQRYCYPCHQAGVAGAPKLGDAAAWADRLAQGRAVMIDNVKRGMPPGMPPRGACASCDDEALAAAVDFMVGQSR